MLDHAAAAALRDRHAAVVSEAGPPRARDAAARLGVSEAELVAARVAGGVGAARDAVDRAWVVQMPSLRGDVHALELYDAGGFAFAQVFGLRPPGEPERADWRDLATGLAAEVTE